MNLKEQIDYIRINHAGQSEAEMAVQGFYDYYYGTIENVKVIIQYPVEKEVSMGVELLGNEVSKIQVDIKDLVKDQRVTFQYYRDNALWYQTDNGFRFPVPVKDIDKGVFLPSDKAIIYMRWIRWALDNGRGQFVKERGVAQW